MTTSGQRAGLTFESRAGRWVLLATVLGSGIAALDATVVNVALPAIGRDLHAQVSGLQWIVTSYLLTLASLILVGGSLGDRLGRRRVFLVGVVWFTVASVGCGLAPTLGALIAARAIQGVGGALLTPGSLAIIEASFVPDDRARAIGAWSGLGGVATAVVPFVGGWLISSVSWRLVFLLNAPLAVAVLIAARHVPESRDPQATGSLDVPGALLAVAGLGGVTAALIEARALPAALVTALALAGVGSLAALVVVERHRRNPMLDLSLFASRQFTTANLVTVTVYAALGGLFFLLAVDLQQALHYSPVAAGAALFPVTVIMLLFSSRAGLLARRIGPRLPMTVGPIVVGVGLLLMRRINPGGHYVSTVLPAVVVFGAGLALTVAPLTATVLAAVDSRHAGVASGINNAVARAAGLLAVAVLPVLVGLRGRDYARPAALTTGFHSGALIAAVLCFMGAALAWAGIRTPDAAREEIDAVAGRSHCAMDGPPLSGRG